MKTGFPVIIFISILIFIAVIDSYAFRGIRILSSGLPVWLRISVHILYWTVPVVIILFLVYAIFNIHQVFTSSLFRIWYFIAGMLILFYVPKLVFIVFQLLNDLTRLSGLILSKVSEGNPKLAYVSNTMTRSEFLTKSGIIVAAVPFLSILHGIAWGRFNYKINKIILHFENLPNAFNGYRILQISDWHIGSFYGHHDKVEKSVELINQERADLILFTGDMVNNVAEEMRDFIPLLNKISAPDGVYSILGNHDYGEYVQWENKEQHQQNMKKLFEYEGLSGFNLLKNDSVIIEKNGEKIGLAGVENWGLPPFKQYGNLDLALEKIKSLTFKILMSHDPSHWDAEVIKKSDVDLTLSGHTHGMQFGIDIPGFKWSPVKWKYPRWSGLYKENSQYLYVNVGIGYIGFPGRVGIYPEITVFELRKKV
jgi:predicted MPP superfamily phosphohydrolase